MCFCRWGIISAGVKNIELARDLGINTIRYSVPWYRSNPAPGCYDWEWLIRPVEWLVNNGITPVMDIIHYGTPTWMAQGCGDERFPEALAEYARAFACRFAGLVNHYTPMNEPQLAALWCGYDGRWPPYETGVAGWHRALLSLGKALALASRALRDNCRTAC